jgi:Predicted HD superfamily hydrolase involved in NAD metabolism
MKNYLDYRITGDLVEDVKVYFSKFNCKDVYEHTMDVVKELRYIEKLYGHIEEGSLIACYCHDLGRVVKNDDILDFCIKHDIMIADEERKLPTIIHQKISCFIAESVFKITDKSVLDAIRYHTTLRSHPSVTEMEVFLSDKMSWIEGDYIELANRIKSIVVESKEKAVLLLLK